MANQIFLPEDQFPDDLDPQATLDVLDARLRDPSLPPPDLIVTDAPPPPLGRSWAFDFTTNRLVAAASGVSETHGLATLRTWIEKCLRTDRGAHPIHSDDYGMVRPFDMIGHQLTDVSKDDVRDRVTDALTKHPSIAAIDQFDMTYTTDGDDALFVDFNVVTSDGSTLPISNLRLP